MAEIQDRHSVTLLHRPDQYGGKPIPLSRLLVRMESTATEAKWTEVSKPAIVATWLMEMVTRNDYG